MDFNFTAAKFTKKIGWKRKARGVHLLEKTSLICTDPNSCDKVKKRGKDDCVAAFLDNSPKKSKTKLNLERSIA